MRKIKLYSIYDLKAQRYDTPFFCKDDINAKRHFIMMADQNGSMVNTFLKEFELRLLCEFDVLLGVITVYENIKTVLEGKQILKEENKK